MPSIIKLTRMVPVVLLHNFQIIYIYIFSFFDLWEVIFDQKLNSKNFGTQLFMVKNVEIFKRRKKCKDWQNYDDNVRHFYQERWMQPTIIFAKQ